MKKSKDSMDRIKAALSLAHQSKTAGSHPVDKQWRQNVMRSVRQIGRPNPDAVHRLGFPQLAWRLAPVAIALMIFLGVMIFRIDDTVEYQLAGLMVSDPVQTYIAFDPL